MQKEGKTWRIQRELGSGEMQAVGVGERRGNRLFYRKMLRDAHELEASEAAFNSGKAAGSGTYWVQYGKIQEAKRELAGFYGAKQELARECIAKKPELPFKAFWAGLGIAMFAESLLPANAGLHDIAVLSGFSIALSGAIGVFKAFVSHSKIDDMLYGIGVERGPRMVINSPLDRF